MQGIPVGTPWKLGKCGYCFCWSWWFCLFVCLLLGVFTLFCFFILLSWFLGLFGLAWVFFVLFFLSRKQCQGTDILKAFHIKFHVIVIDRQLNSFSQQGGRATSVAKWPQHNKIVAAWANFHCMHYLACPLALASWYLVKCSSSLHNDQLWPYTSTSWPMAPLSVDFTLKKKTGCLLGRPVRNQSQIGS